MNRVLGLLALLALVMVPTPPARAGLAGPATLALSAEVLTQARENIQKRDTTALAAWNILRQQAETALHAPVETVTAKPAPPPGASPNDYASLSPYWWPDPAMPGGLPYVRRDGERNPEADSPAYDRNRLATMARLVETLALAYYFSDDERYADRAATHLRAWFLEPSTRMNPDMAHAQNRPGPGRGDHTGSHTGIVEARHLIRVADAARILIRSNAWAEGDDTRLKQWFSDLADWMITSDLGRAEDSMRNNHATWYDAQLAVYLLFAGRTALARTVLISVPQRRLRFQIDRDGAQPLEEARTRPRHYVFFNLQAMFVLASAAETIHMDLWHRAVFAEPVIKAALDHAAPYLDPAAPWPGADLDVDSGAKTGPFDPWAYVPLFRRAALVYKSRDYLDRLEFLPADERTRDPRNLYY